MLQPTFGCPGGHDLEIVKAPDGRGTCSGCKAPLKYRSSTAVCRACDVRYCAACAQPSEAGAGSSPPPAKRAKTSAAAGATAEAGAGGAAGCPWTGKTSERAAHARECDFEEATCRLAGCAEKVLRRALAAHESRCTHNHVPCPDCKERVRHRELEAHRETCGMAMVACRNGPRWHPCGKKMRRKAVAAHTEICPLAKVECPFAPHGCDDVVRREDYVGRLCASLRLAPRRHHHRCTSVRARARAAGCRDVPMHMMGFELRVLCRVVPTCLATRRVLSVCACVNMCAHRRSIKHQRQGTTPSC